MDNRFNGLSKASISTGLETRWFEVVAIQETVETVSNFDDLNTGLKPGENENRIFEAKRRREVRASHVEGT